MKPGDYVIVENPADGMNKGDLIRVCDVDGYGRFHLYGFDGPWNPERFTPAPSYDDLAKQLKNAKQAVSDLADAILKSAVDLGIVTDLGRGFTGPEVLLLLSDITGLAAQTLTQD